MTLSPLTPTATTVAHTVTLRVPLSFMALRPSFSPATRASENIFQHHHCQPNSALLRQNGDKLTSLESRILSRQSVHTVNYSYPSFSERPSESTPSSRPLAKHCRRSLFRKGASVDSSRYAFSGASRRSRTSRAVGAISALGLGFDGQLAVVAGASGSDQYGEVLQAARSVLVGIPGRMDSAGLPAVNLVHDSTTSSANERTCRILANDSFSAQSESVQDVGGSSDSTHCLYLYTSDSNTPRVVPTNESMFSVYNGFFTHISTSFSDFWIGLQLPGGDASQTIIFYIAILLLLYGLVLQPK